MKNWFNSPVRLFAALCVVCVLGLAGYYNWIRNKDSAPVQTGVTVTAGSGSPAVVREPVVPSAPLAPTAIDDKARSVSSTAPAAKRIVFRNTAMGSHYGNLAFLNYPMTGQTPQFVKGFSCEVVHVAGGQGICLTADRGVFTTYTARLFDVNFQDRFTIPLKGVPSRCRMSPNGKVAVFTVFLTGHSYTSMDFTTQTILLETGSGAVIANLEDFAVTRDGQPFRAADFNYWGVTFTPDSKNFFCTLSSNRKHYLVKGDIASRTASVIHENVECPSLSPDGARVAYKKRFVIDNRLVWQLHILDVASGKEEALAERRSVDDQLEWLDENHVLYALPESETGTGTTVWQVSADGKKPPGVFLSKAYSPAVVR
jgi:hypothetical protein